MKRFITLILMLTTLLAFTQKVTALTPLFKNETSSLVNGLMSVGLNESHNTDCGGDGMPHSMDYQSDCHFMTLISALYFIGHDHSVNQAVLQLTYQTGSSAAPYFLPESLYRPPSLIG
jgi:hypothetical protein